MVCNKHLTYDAFTGDADFDLQYSIWGRSNSPPFPRGESCPREAQLQVSSNDSIPMSLGVEKSSFDGSVLPRSEANKTHDVRAPLVAAAPPLSSPVVEHEPTTTKDAEGDAGARLSCHGITACRGARVWITFLSLLDCFILGVVASFASCVAQRPRALRSAVRSKRAARAPGAARRERRLRAERRRSDGRRSNGCRLLVLLAGNCWWPGLAGAMEVTWRAGEGAGSSRVEGHMGSWVHAASQPQSLATRELSDGAIPADVVLPSEFDGRQLSELAEWAAQAYLKAANTGAYDSFSRYSVALDGDTLVVGAHVEDGCGTSIVNGASGYDTANGCADAGAAYVFVRSGVAWSAQAYLKAANADGGDILGASVALDGDTLVVGASAEDGCGTSIVNGASGYDTANGCTSAGAAYVFVTPPSPPSAPPPSLPPSPPPPELAEWAAQAYLKAANHEAGDFFGLSMALDGDTVVVGAMYEAGCGTSIVNGASGYDTANDCANAGAAYVFMRSGVTWSAQAYLKAANAEANDNFGYFVALDGDMIVVGAYGEEGCGTSIVNGASGYDTANGCSEAGAAYVFVIPPSPPSPPPPSPPPSPPPPSPPTPSPPPPSPSPPPPPCPSPPPPTPSPAADATWKYGGQPVSFARTRKGERVRVKAQKYDATAPIVGLPEVTYE